MRVRELVDVLHGEDLDVLLDVARAADRNVAAEKRLGRALAGESQA